MVIHNPSTRIPGSLRAHLPRWRQLRSQLPLDILEILEDGAPLLFPGRPPPRRRVQQLPWSKQTEQILRQYVSDGLASGLLKRCPPNPQAFRVTSPVYAIPKKEPGKFRIILDLRYVNLYQQAPRFRMEGLRTVRTVIQPHDWMTKIDLKDAFHHPLHSPQATKYVAFTFLGQDYEYQALSMGSASSPYILHRLLRPVIQELRMSGCRLIPYVDDICIFASSPQESVRRTQQVASLLTSLGWHINTPKCVLVPSQQVVFLGLQIDTSGPQPRFRVPPQRKHALLHELQRFHRRAEASPVPRRHLARIIGLMQSVSRALTPSRLLTRTLIQDLGRSRCWNTSVRLTNASLRDLRLWQDILRYWNGETILSPPVDVCLTTDASNKGWGGVLFTTPRQTVSDGWTEQEDHLHINAKELWAVHHSLQRMAPLLKNKVVRVQCDNSVAVCYLQRWTGRVPHLSLITQKIFWLCKQHQITLLPEFLPGAHNREADHASRNPDHLHWTIRPEVFRELDKRWGPHTVDRFALPSNAVVPRFNTRHYHPEAEAIDGLLQPWTNEVNWINPPFVLMEEILQRLRSYSQVQATVIAPVWPSQPWYHPLLEMSEEAYLLPENSVALTGTGTSPSSIPKSRWRLMALRISSPTTCANRDYLPRLKPLSVTIPPGP